MTRSINLLIIIIICGFCGTAELCVQCTVSLEQFASNTARQQRVNVTLHTFKQRLKTYLGPICGTNTIMALLRRLCEYGAVI